MTSRPDGTFLTRVRLRNYKSIAECDVQLGPLTFLVGPNGAGKSNFLDALRLVADTLQAPLDVALRNRGGFQEVVRRTSGSPASFGIDIEFSLSRGRRGHFGLDVIGEAAGLRPAYKQRYWIGDDDYRDDLVPSQDVVHSALEPIGPISLASSNAPEFRRAYERLVSMSSYSPSPKAMSELESLDAGERLLWDAGNVANVLARLQQDDPSRVERINEYLRLIVPGLDSASPLTLGPRRTVRFTQSAGSAGNSTTFYAANMSDGTLRALGILTALFQRGGVHAPAVVGIEEPEAALHPGAVGILLGALEEASRETQVLVTSHSPDLLDDKHITADQILAVSAESGSTRIAPIDAVGRDVLRRRLYTAGELLRLGELRPEPVDGSRSDPAAPGMVADREG